MHQKKTKNQLLLLLQGKGAHLTFEEVVHNFPQKAMNLKPLNTPYSPWHILEHLRITQQDILEFTRNPKYKPLKWPKDYWPPKDEKATKKMWKNTLDQFLKDREQLEMIIIDPKTDIFSIIPHTKSTTIFREILLVADHNAYHIGEFAILRQVMNTWNR